MGLRTILGPGELKKKVTMPLFFSAHFSAFCCVFQWPTFTFGQGIFGTRVNGQSFSVFQDHLEGGKKQPSTLGSFWHLKWLGFECQFSVKSHMGVSKNTGFSPQIIHLFIGFGTMIFTIHFGGFTPIFGNTHMDWTVSIYTWYIFEDVMGHGHGTGSSAWHPDEALVFGVGAWCKRCPACRLSIHSSCSHQNRKKIARPYCYERFITPDPSVKKDI